MPFVVGAIVSFHSFPLSNFTRPNYAELIVIFGISFYLAIFGVAEATSQ